MILIYVELIIAMDSNHWKHLGVQIWQEIPKSIQMIRSVKMFLKFLKKWYINEEIDWWLYFYNLWIHAT